VDLYELVAAQEVCGRRRCNVLDIGIHMHHIVCGFEVSFSLLT